MRLAARPHRRPRFKAGAVFFCGFRLGGAASACPASRIHHRTLGCSRITIAPLRSVRRSCAYSEIATSNAAFAMTMLDAAAMVMRRLSLPYRSQSSMRKAFARSTSCKLGLAARAAAYRSENIDHHSRAHIGAGYRATVPEARAYKYDRQAVAPDP
jgi:hypothetical protein